MSKAQKALFSAVGSYSMRGIAQAVTDGANLDEPMTYNGLTPIASSAGSGGTGTYMKCAEYGASVNSRCSRGGTPLHHAAIAWPNDYYNVEIMAWYGADTDARDNSGQTPLHWITSDGGGKWKTAEGLLRDGADVNAEDHNGLTPLDHLQNDSGETAAVLLRWGGRRTRPARAMRV